MADSEQFLAIRGVGPALAEKLARAFKSIDDLRNLSAEKLAEDAGIALGRAKQIVEALKSQDDVSSATTEPLVNELEVVIQPDLKVRVDMSVRDQAGNAVGPVVTIEGPKPLKDFARSPFTPPIPEFELPTPVGGITRGDKLLMIGTSNKKGPLWTARVCPNCGAIIGHLNPEVGRPRERHEKPDYRPGSVHTYSICTCDRKGTTSPSDSWGSKGIADKMVDNRINDHVFSYFANYNKV